MACSRIRRCTRRLAGQPRGAALRAALVASR